jgi:arylsulfatase A-like enzyme
MGRDYLHREEVTLAECFKSSGYATALIGKWHLGQNYPYRPVDRGFDEWYGFEPRYWANDMMNDTLIHRDRWEKTTGYRTDVLFDKTMDFIEARGNQPFFIFLCPFAAHEPWYVPEEWLKPYFDRGIRGDMAHFYAMISRLDDNIGRLERFLSENALEDDTILIFMTDNGSAYRTSDGFNAGMRGFKGSIYDGGHRVPFFIRWPGGGIRPGKEIGRLTAHVDIMPTLIDLCELNGTGDIRFDGKSLVPLLRGKKSGWPERTLFVESQRIIYPRKWRTFAMMTDRWRLVNGDELYDIKADPGQRDDVAHDHREVVQELRAEYEKLWEEISSRDEEFGRPIIGSEKQEVTRLFSLEWIPTEGPFAPWRHDEHILKGVPWNGYWEVEIAQDGVYEFELRRWPEEVDWAIAGALPAAEKSDVVGPGPDGRPIPVKMGRGTALPITKARLRVDDKEMQKQITENETFVVFAMELKGGQKRIQTWFLSDEEESWGAYFVYARRVA